MGNQQRKGGNGSGFMRALVISILFFLVATAVRWCDPAAAVSQLFGKLTGGDSSDSVGISLPFGIGSSGSGADLSSERYDASIRPYYALLDEQEQEDYQRILEALLDQESSVALSGNNNSSTVSTIIESVLNDQPDIFWVGNTYRIIGDGAVSKVEFQFLYNDQDLTQMRQEFDDVTQEIIAPLQGMSPVEQEKAVFDEISRRVVYDGSGEDQGQGAYAALVEGRAVCAGYSRAFQHLMLSLGNTCYYLTGQAEGQDFLGSGWGPHGWNLVELDGNWYNVDVTWGDSGTFDMDGVNYQYFNVSDGTISADHQRDNLALQLPICALDFDFEGAFGVDPAAASLESAGLSVDVVAYSQDEYVDGVMGMADGLSNGGFTFTAVVYGMDSDSLSAARGAALDGLVAYAQPGQSVSVSGTSQEYASGVLLVQDQYTLE